MFCRLVRPNTTLRWWWRCTEHVAVKYVPQWFPGAGFQRRAARWRSVIATVVNQPWKFAKDGWVCSGYFSRAAATYIATVGWNCGGMRGNRPPRRTTNRRRTARTRANRQRLRCCCVYGPVHPLFFLEYLRLTRLCLQVVMIL